MCTHNRSTATLLCGMYGQHADDSVGWRVYVLAGDGLTAFPADLEHLVVRLGDLLRLSVRATKKKKRRRRGE